MSSGSPPTIPRSILLLGAGELGTAILRALSAHPALVNTRTTVLLRPPSLGDATRLDSLRALRPKNLSFTALDLSVPTARADLTAHIRDAGYDVVISCTGFTTNGSGDGTQHMITAAVLDAGVGKGGSVQRYIPWQFGVDYDVIGPEAAGGLMKEQVAVRSLLRGGDSGVEWTIVSTGMFMSFVFEDRFGAVQGLRGVLDGDETIEGHGEVIVRGLGGWGNAVTLTDAEDIGKVVADVLAAPPGRNDRGGSVVFTSGQTVTYRELADIVEKVVGGKRNVRREEWTPEFLRDELKKDPELPMKKYRVLFGEGKGVSWDMGMTLNSHRDMKTMGVEEWLRRKMNA